ncbi:hypothetical protein [Chryseobacterium gleum]|uniref:hypothetical protein n=1 Tax=Chryseobacterium gleum TaxID=250 RepID=UPI00241CC01A|nr:hypothetical protein [Chryseobacterium gleum]
MKYSKIIIVVTLLLFQLGTAQEKADVVVNKAITEAKAGKKNVLLICFMVQMVQDDGKEYGSS